MRRLAPLVLLLVLWVPTAGAWTWPVSGPLLQGFSFDHAHPYAAGQHRGIDVGATAGSPVLAPASGVVSFAGAVPASGKTVTIETPDGVAMTLTHLGAIAVAQNATVAEGSVVGSVGSSGTPEVEGPYVHLGLRTLSDAQGYLDPLGFLPAFSLPVPVPAPAPAEPTAVQAPAAPPALVEPPAGAAPPAAVEQPAVIEAPAVVESPAAAEPPAAVDPPLPAAPPLETPTRAAPVVEQPSAAAEPARAPSAPATVEPALAEATVDLPSAPLVEAPAPDAAANAAPAVDASPSFDAAPVQPLLRWGLQPLGGATALAPEPVGEHGARLRERPKLASGRAVRPQRPEIGSVKLPAPKLPVLARTGRRLRVPTLAAGLVALVAVLAAAAAGLARSRGSTLPSAPVRRLHALRPVDEAAYQDVPRHDRLAA